MTLIGEIKSHTFLFGIICPNPVHIFSSRGRLRLLTLFLSQPRSGVRHEAMLDFAEAAGVSPVPLHCLRQSVCPGFLLQVRVYTNTQIVVEQRQIRKMTLDRAQIQREQRNGNSLS